jgi:hypothetical protein
MKSPSGVTIRGTFSSVSPRQRQLLLEVFMHTLQGQLCSRLGYAFTIGLLLGAFLAGISGSFAVPF